MFSHDGSDSEDELTIDHKGKFVSLKANSTTTANSNTHPSIYANTAQNHLNTNYSSTNSTSKQSNNYRSIESNQQKITMPNIFPQSEHKHSSTKNGFKKSPDSQHPKKNLAATFTSGANNVKTGSQNTKPAIRQAPNTNSIANSGLAPYHALGLFAHNANVPDGTHKLADVSSEHQNQPVAFESIISANTISPYHNAAAYLQSFSKN